MKTRSILLILAAMLMTAGGLAQAQTVDIDALLAEPPTPQITQAGPADLRADLAAEVKETLDGWPWAPFYCSIGIGSRDFPFAHPSYSVRALAMAYPYLPADLARRAKAQAAKDLAACITQTPLALNRGRRRELFDINPSDLGWAHTPDWPTISHVHAVWLHGNRTGDWNAVRAVWRRVRQAWQAHRREFPDGYTPHLYMNRTASGLIAYARLAKRFGAPNDAKAAAAELGKLLKVIGDYHAQRGKQAATALAQADRKGSRPPGLNSLLYMQVHKINHQKKIALFMDMTPSLAMAIAQAQPEAVKSLDGFVELYMPAWYLGFEERQIHYGENFVELPDSVMGIFLCKAYMWDATPAELAKFTDLPWVKADLFHIEKLALAIEASTKGD